MKTLVKKCKKLKTLLLQNTGIESEAIKQVEWDQTCLEELDLTSTDLNEQALLLMLNNSPNLRYLSVAHCDGFTDNVSNNNHSIVFKLIYLLIYILGIFNFD